MRKNISKQLSLFGIAQLFNLGLYCQNIYFDYTDGSNSVYDLEDVRKITFDSDLMNLHLLDGSIYSWNVSTIGYYNYEETPLNIEQIINNANTLQVLVFPNPAYSSLQVQYSLPKADIIRIGIYDLQGKLLIEKNMGNQTIGQYQTILDLSCMTAGVYLCRITGEINSISKRIVKQ
jgi:hypothetical protein